MKNIFKRSRFKVSDNGFTTNVLQQVLPYPNIKRPSKNIYRLPTLYTAAASVVVMVVLGGSGLLQKVNMADQNQKILDNIQKVQLETLSLLDNLFVYK